MERKIKYIKIPYFEKGEEKQIDLEVKFIPNYVHTELGKITSDIYHIKDIFSKRLEAMSEISAMKNNGKPDKFKVKQLETKMKEFEQEIFKFGKTDFFKRRFELIKLVLENNGVTEERFLTLDFWDKCVDANDLVQFLDDVAYKDFEDKKKVVM
jgi:hypothetical protein